MDGGWTPNQREAIERLLGLDDDLRPVSNTRGYDQSLHLRLRQDVQAAIEDIAVRYTAAKPLLIRKRREKLETLRRDGRDPAHGGDAGRKRGRAVSERLRQAAQFERSIGLPPSPDIFRREILPLIQSIPARRLAEATGLSRPYCSQVVRGASVPHPIHWEAFRAIASAG